MRLRAITALAVGTLIGGCPMDEDRMPRSVAEAAAAHDCTALGSSAAEDDLIEPWLVDLAPLTGVSGDKAFLCRAAGEERQLLLVVEARSAQSPWRGCEAAIPLSTVFDPGGLAVTRPAASVFAERPLDEWLDADGAPGPAGVTPEAPILDTTGDVAGWAFYCHEGRWLSAFFH